MLKRLSRTAVCTVAAFSVSGAGAMPLPRLDAGGAGILHVGGPVPRAHPSRSGGAGAGDDAPSLADDTAASVGTVVAGAPFPRPRPGPGRPNIVARVTDGQIVPLAPTAFAARADGPVESLFEAVDAEASGDTPPAPAEPQQAIVASLAAPSVSPAAPAATPAALALAAHGRADGTAFNDFGKRSGSLKAALDALKADRYDEVLQRRNGLRDPIDKLIVDYFVVRAGPKQLTTAMVLDFSARAGDWVTPEFMRSRIEESLSRDRASPDAVIKILGGSAYTEVGMRLLANAYFAKGDRTRGLALVRTVWHNEPLGTGLQQAYIDDFSQYLSIEDHLIRVDRLVGEGRFSEANALRPRLGTGPRAYVDALVAAAEGSSNAGARLKAVPSDLRRRPGYARAEVEHLRRADDLEAAARVIEGVSPRSVVDGDAWWVETRIVARSLAEEGKWRRAYKLAEKGFAVDREEKADEAFHAGWFALEGLKDGRVAERHFAVLASIATTPLSISRAAYWRGRAASARGDTGSARRYYDDAARYGFTYYGQLARVELGRGGTGVPRAPQLTAADKVAFSKNSMAEAVRRLIANGHEHRIWPLLKRLADTVPTPGQAALVVELGEKAGTPHLGLMAAKAAQARGLDVGRLAYPTEHIPKSAKVPAGLDLAVVYSIARQESQFNSGARSPVGAAGLMQVMPRTASSMARELGLKHTDQRLTSDPAYNATLGAAYLKKRLDNFDGSFILTFAAYNAGAGRVSEWIGRFGDPRDPRVDPVTWVEQIPYPETRNYVQRVMENVQIYREALGTGRMAITTDLARGRRS